MDDRRTPGAGGVVFDAEGRLLLVRRGREPLRGMWSVPGGHVEPGEEPHETVVREVFEETGLRVRVARLAGVVERTAASGEVFVIHDFVCDLVEGDLPLAGDDADDVRYVPVDELDGFPLVPGLLEALREWGLVGPLLAD